MTAQLKLGLLEIYKYTKVWGGIYYGWLPLQLKGKEERVERTRFFNKRGQASRQCDACPCIQIKPKSRCTQMQRLFCFQTPFNRRLFCLFQHDVGVVQGLATDVDFMARGPLERVDFHRVASHPFHGCFFLRFQFHLAVVSPRHTNNPICSRLVENVTHSVQTSRPARPPAAAAWHRCCCGNSPLAYTTGGGTAASGFAHQQCLRYRAGRFHSQQSY